MSDAYIIDSRRTGIGRAFKGSLVGQRSDDMVVAVSEALFAAAPSLPRDEVDELLLGCGLPAGEQGATWRESPP